LINKHFFIYEISTFDALFINFYFDFWGNFYRVLNTIEAVRLWFNTACPCKHLHLKHPRHKDHFVNCLTFSKDSNCKCSYVVYADRQRLKATPPIFLETRADNRYCLKTENDVARSVGCWRHTCSNLICYQISIFNPSCSIVETSYLQGLYFPQMLIYNEYNFVLCSSS
jgi:hypothetical protein